MPPSAGTRSCSTFIRASSSRLPGNALSALCRAQRRRWHCRARHSPCFEGDSTMASSSRRASSKLISARSAEADAGWGFIGHRNNPPANLSRRLISTQDRHPPARCQSPISSRPCQCRGDRLLTISDGALAYRRHARLYNMPRTSSSVSRRAIGSLIPLHLPALPSSTAACHSPRRTAHRGFSHIIKEIADRHIENLTDIPQARGADPVGAALIFLHLLKSYI